MFLASEVARLSFISGSEVWPGDNLAFSGENLIDGNWAANQYQKSCYHSKNAQLENFVLFRLRTPAVVEQVLWQLRSQQYGSSREGQQIYLQHGRVSEMKQVFFCVSAENYEVKVCVSESHNCYNCPRVTPDPLDFGQIVEFECGDIPVVNFLRVTSPPGIQLIGCEMEVKVQPPVCI